VGFLLALSMLPPIGDSRIFSNLQFTLVENRLENIFNQRLTS
jgi:hypothetical protein